MINVLDAHGLLVFLQRETGYENVRSFLADALEKNTSLLMTSVNYGEAYYIVLREQGEAKANEIEDVIKTLPIEIVEVDVGMASVAARFKARKRMSYADCFAAALAKLREGVVITGDREFEVVEGEIQVAWIY